MDRPKAPVLIPTSFNQQSSKVTSPEWLEYYEKKYQYDNVFFDVAGSGRKWTIEGVQIIAGVPTLKLKEI